jgi:hypothetical protein
MIYTMWDQEIAIKYEFDREITLELENDISLGNIENISTFKNCIEDILFWSDDFTIHQLHEELLVMQLFLKLFNKTSKITALIRKVYYKLNHYELPPTYDESTLMERMMKKIKLMDI